MSFGNWFGERKDAASYFLKTGNITPTLGGTSCRSAGDCGSNYACINGKCQNLSPQKLSEDCGTGTRQCATECGQSTPGAECIASDCCGTRFCRYYGAEGIICACGEPPQDEKECSAFCTAYSQNSPTLELPEGCSLGTNVCNECESCVSTFWGGSRCEVFTGGPCWCQEPGGRFCEVCTESGSWAISPDCFTCKNQLKCGEPTGKQYCVPGIRDLTLLQSVNGESFYLPCDEECTPICTGISVTLTGAYNPAYTYPSCCPTCECTLNGYIRADNSNETTYIITSCDSSLLPPGCEPVGCNCHSDCQSGEKCSVTTLTCVPDPSVPT